MPNLKVITLAVHEIFALKNHLIFFEFSSSVAPKQKYYYTTPLVSFKFDTHIEF